MRPFSSRPAALMYQAFCFPEGDTIAGHVHELHTAAMLGDFAEVTRLLPLVEDVNSTDARGCAAIHFGALTADVELVLLLINHGADVSARTATSATALHVAAYNGRLAVCKLLMLHGADPNAEDDEGRTPLYDARFMMLGACPCSADTAEAQNGRTAAFLERAMRLAPEERREFVARSWGLFVSEVLQDL